MSGEEPVTSPDQHSPGHLKAARIAGIATIVVLLLLMIGNQQGHVEDLWLGGVALVIALILLADWAMRKNGLKR